MNIMTRNPFFKSGFKVLLFLRYRVLHLALGLMICMSASGLLLSASSASVLGSSAAESSAVSDMSSAGEFGFFLNTAIRSYADNIFLLQTPEPGSYVITVRDSTTVYRILTGSISCAGQTEIHWDGAGYNEERLDQRKYDITASFTGESGIVFESSLIHTVAYSAQAINYALPSSDVLNLRCRDQWFLECKAVMDGTIVLDFIPQKKAQSAAVPSKTDPVFSVRYPLKGGDVTKITFKQLTATRRPALGTYTVKAYDPRNPAFGKEFVLTVVDEDQSVLPITPTGDLIPSETADDAEIWAIMMEPSVVVDIGFHQHQAIREAPDDKSRSLGTVHGQTQALKVIEVNKNGWSRVGAWNHETGSYVEGWVPTNVLKWVRPQKDYGLLFDKTKQTLVVFYQGKRLDTLQISTGKAAENHEDQETPSGAFLTGTHRKGFSSNGKKFDYVIQYDGGNMIHQIPYRWGNNKRDFAVGTEALGEKASHGCIRVQADPSEKEGLNAYWLWTHIPFGTRVIILGD